MGRSPNPVDQRPDAPHPGAPARGEYVELWLRLARRDWGSLVLIPADPEGSTADIGKWLADVGQRLSFLPVTAISVSALEYGSAFALADLQQHMDRDRRRLPERSPLVDVTAPTVVPGNEPETARPKAVRSEALATAPAARLIISVPPVLTQPLGLAAADQADAVVISVQMGHTRLADLRRTVDLVGRDRIAGCFLVR